MVVPGVILREHYQASGACIFTYLQGFHVLLRLGVSHLGVAV